MKRLTLFVCVAIAALPVVCLSAETDEIDELVKTVTESARNDAERAEKLIDAAAALDDTPAVQKAFYEKAYDYGLKLPAGYDVAMKALDELEGLDGVSKADIDERRTRLWRLKYSRARTTEDRKAAAAGLMKALVAAGDAKVAAGTPSAAIPLYSEALRLAAFVNDQSAKGSITATIADARSKMVLESKIKVLKAAVEKNPDDQESLKKLILACFIDLNDPVAAQKLLPGCEDLMLQTCIPMATKDPADISASDCLELAKWLEDISKSASGSGKLNVLARAKACYDRAIGSGELESVDTLKAKLALRRVEQNLEALGYTPPGSVKTKTWVDLMPYFDPEWALTQGTVVREGRAVIMAEPREGETSFTVFPVTPTGSYRFRVGVAGKSVAYGATMELPVGREHIVKFGFSPVMAGFGPINGLEWIERTNKTHVRFPDRLPPAGTYGIEVTVVHDNGDVKLLAAIGGRKIISWQGDTDDLDRHWGIPLISMSTERGSATFREPALYIESGEGTVRSPAEDRAYAEKHVPVIDHLSYFRVPAALPGTLAGRVEKEGKYQVKHGFGYWYHGFSERAKVKASGSPDGKYHLQGWIGDGTPFRLQEDSILEAERAGPLYLGMSDQEGDEFNDNYGFARVSLTALPEKTPSDGPGPLWHSTRVELPGTVKWVPVGTVEAGQYYRVDANRPYGERGWRVPGQTELIGPDGKGDKYYLQLRIAGGAPVRFGTKPAIYHAATGGLLEAGISHPSLQITGECRMSIRRWDLVQQAGAVRQYIAAMRYREMKQKMREKEKKPEGTRRQELIREKMKRLRQERVKKNMRELNKKGPR